MLSQVLRQAWQEVTLLSLCCLALIAMVFDRGFDDPASMLWMVMLLVQSVPYAATVATALLSAVSNAERAALAAQHAIAPPPPKFKEAA